MPTLMLERATPALRDSIAREFAEESEIEFPEPPPAVIQTKFDGSGRIRFICNAEQSRKITGNGTGGDDRIIWDRRYKDNVEDARKKFYQLLDNGFIAFRTRDNGKAGERMYQFEPDAEEILMTAPVVAG